MSDDPVTILIVDDDEDVRNIWRRLLEMKDYTVLEAVNGKEGVEVFQQHSDEIHLVLLDWIVPVMNGEEALAKMLEIDPEIKVILCAGVDLRWEHLGARGLLIKPKPLDELIQKIQDVLM